MKMASVALWFFSVLSVFSVTIGIAASAAAAQSTSTSSGQAYPTKPIRIIASTTPGSGPDIMSRLIGQKLTEAWGQQIVVDNRAGGSGIIGTEIAARAAPDGYTLLMLTSSHVIVAALFQKLNYDLVRDFTPISLLASTPFILTVHPSVPAASVKELIALAKSRPGELHYGSGGPGTPPHLATEILKTMTGVDLFHVPYKGITPALIDTVAGQVQMTIAVVPAVLPFLKTGKLKALGVTSTKRTPLAPEVPTIAETVPGYEVIGWYSLVAPAKTPENIISRLNTEVVRALKTPEIQQRISGLGAEPIGSTPRELGAYMRAEIDKLQKAVKAANLRRE
ncbi:MAG: tripartite tricarboxylate transporter substrate binding protein [Betaproteobacteria bacterium]|nr:tripartite tricarboxylate transporter substrate binding protein [Betaproteobacteria bacterium]